MVSKLANQLICTIYQSRERSFSDCIATALAESTLCITRRANAKPTQHQIASLADDVCCYLDGMNGLPLSELFRVPCGIETVDEFLYSYSKDFLWESEPFKTSVSHIDFGRWAAAIVMHVFVAECESDYARVSSVANFFKQVISFFPTDHAIEIASCFHEICMHIEGLGSLSPRSGAD